MLLKWNLSSQCFLLRFSLTVISCHTNLNVSQILESTLSLTLLYCAKMLLLFSKLPVGCGLLSGPDQWARTITKVTELMDKREKQAEEWGLCKKPWQHKAQVSRMNVLRNTCIHWAVSSCEPWHLICLPGLRSAPKKRCKTFIKRKRWCVDFYSCNSEI